MAEFLNPTTFLVAIIGLAVSLVLGLRLAKDPSFGLVLLLFFLPFERIPSVDFAGFTFKINHIIGGLTFLFWLLATVFARRKIAPNPLTIPLLLFFFGLLLSGMNAQNEFRHLTVFISLLIMLCIYLATLNATTNVKTLKLAITALFGSAALMTLIGIYQFFGDLAGLPTTVTGLDPGYTEVVFGFPRVHAFSKEPLYYANYLFIPLGIGLALFFSRNQDDKGQTSKSELGFLEKLSGPWLLPFLLLLLINFILTLSRGAFIAAVPFALIFLSLYAKQILTWRNIILGIVILTVSLGTVIGILESVSPDALERFIGHALIEDVLVKQQGESGFGRLESFGQAIEAWQSAPAFGIGLGNFGPYVDHYPVEAPGRGWDIVNNEYLELLAETGIVGTVLVFLMLGIILWRSIAAYKVVTDTYLRAVLVGLTAAFVAIFTQYNFFSTFYIIHIWVLFGLIIGVQNMILKPKALPVEGYIK